MGSVENCVTVIAKVSMKCSTKVKEIKRHLWQQNQKGFGGYRRLWGVFIKRSFRAVHLFFYRSEWPLSWLVWSIGRLSLYVVFRYRKKRTELLEGERRISSWYSAGSVSLFILIFRDTLHYCLRCWKEVESRPRVGLADFLILCS